MRMAEGPGCSYEYKNLAYDLQLNMLNASPNQSLLIMILLCLPSVSATRDLYF